MTADYRRVIAKPWLNVRKGPSLNDEIVDRLFPGENILVLEDLDSWLGVSSEGGIAYISARWVTSFRFECWPTEYPYTITQGFGANPKDYIQFYGDKRGHQGVDLRARTGTKIMVVASGIVSMTYLNPLPKKQGGHNFGIHCRVIHGRFETIYAHQKELFVEAGDDVEAGHVLGLANSTGYSFDSHLHVVLKQDGRVIDPTPYLMQLQLSEEGSG